MAKERPSWQLADLIDYEFFLDADERQGSADLHARDREIFTRDIAPALPAIAAGEPVPKAERRAVLRRWTDARRRQLKSGSDDPDETLLPGEAFAQVRGGVAATLGVLGLAIGWTAAAAALAYSAGAEPINAFVFFVEFALVQVLILVGAFAVIGARWWFPDVKIPSLARFCVRAAMRLAGALWKRNRVRIAGARRQRAEALFGVLRARHTLYREVLGLEPRGVDADFCRQLQRRRARRDDGAAPVPRPGFRLGIDLAKRGRRCRRRRGGSPRRGRGW